MTGNGERAPGNGGRNVWRARARIAAGLALAALAGAAVLPAAPVKIFQLQSQEAMLRGKLEGVSVDRLGTLALAHRIERVAELEEPYVYAAAAHPRGWVLGTGNAGKVLLVERGGKVETLFTAPEPEVFALAVDADGTVFAGTSPRGRVYRIRDGKGEPFFDPGEAYIWALARDADGALLVATGITGKVFRVDGSGHGTTLVDLDDTHARALLPLPNGDLAIGTAGEGQVVRRGRDGKLATLYDAPQPEVVALAAGAPGEIFAAALESEASVTDLSGKPPTPPVPPGGKPPATAGDSKGAEGGAPAAVVTVASEAEAATSGSRQPGAKGPRSDVVRLRPDGTSESVWSSEVETVFALGWRGERLWVGTGAEGHLWSFDDGQPVLEADFEARQVVALLTDGDGLAAITTNGGAVWTVAAARASSGTYTSPAFDAGLAARFGQLRWQGDTPRGAKLTLAARSGRSAEPDESWTPWLTLGEIVPGADLAFDRVPHGRYVQFRATLTAAAGAARVSGFELSYRQENLRPHVDRFEALEPGQVLVPTAFNPADQIYEPAHPTKDGIFTRLAPTDGRDEGRVKQVWRHGFRTLRWRVVDPNDDELRYALSFRPADTDGAWLAMAKDLEDNYYSFDAMALPDGVYRFRLEASDREGNPGGDALVAEEVSEPIPVDHTPPVLGAVVRRDGALEAEVADEVSPLRDAACSVDAGEWQPAAAADLLLDGRRERLRCPAPAGAHLVLLRVGDASYNYSTFVLAEKTR